MIDQGYMQVYGLKKEPFSGSHHGMRYFLCLSEDPSSFTAYVYPEPWAFEDTPDEDKISEQFPLSEEGMTQAVQWLFRMYETNKERWKDSAVNMMHIVNRT